MPRVNRDGGKSSRRLTTGTAQQPPPAGTSRVLCSADCQLESRAQRAINPIVDRTALSRRSLYYRALKLKGENDRDVSDDVVLPHATASDGAMNIYREAGGARAKRARALFCGPFLLE